jgi:hypothetical protein
MGDVGEDKDDLPEDKTAPWQGGATRPAYPVDHVARARMGRLRNHGHLAEDSGHN